jgi:hypothetical protein
MPIVLLHLLFQLPAMFSAGVGVRGFLPFEMDRKAVPLFLALVFLIVLFLPMTPVIALACVLPIQLAYKFFGESLTSVTPFEVPEWLTHLPRFRTHHVIEYRAVDEDAPTWNPDPMGDGDTEIDEDDSDSEVEEKPAFKSFIPDIP